MAMKIDSRYNAVAVHLHRRRIGVIDRLAGDQHLFSFERNYADDPNRSPLSLSFKGPCGSPEARFARPASAADAQTRESAPLAEAGVVT
jgi:hypothetical protein